MKGVTRRTPILCADCKTVRSEKVPAKTAPDAAFPYVLSSDLPPEQLTTIWPWLLGQTRSIVESEGLGAYSCIYYHDYERWYKEWAG